MTFCYILQLMMELKELLFDSYMIKLEATCWMSISHRTQVLGLKFVV